MPSAGRADPPACPEDPDPLESAYAHAGQEPLLDEVLGDPVVQLIMQSDRVQPADLQHLLEAAQGHIATQSGSVVLRPQ